MCINGMVIVGETLTQEQVASPFFIGDHCFDPNGLLIAVNGVETYTTETSCLAANANNSWSIASISGDQTTQGILSTDGTYITSLGLTSYCTINNVIDTTILTSTACTAASGTWTAPSSNPLAVLLGDIWVWDAIWGFINIITAGNLFTLLGSWGFEDVFVQLLQGIMGIYLALTIISIKWKF